jgi:hypothetical protein
MIDHHVALEDESRIASQLEETGNAGLMGLRSLMLGLFSILAGVPGFSLPSSSLYLKSTPRKCIVKKAKVEVCFPL